MYIEQIYKQALNNKDIIHLINIITNSSINLYNYYITNIRDINIKFTYCNMYNINNLFDILHEIYIAIDIIDKYIININDYITFNFIKVMLKFIKNNFKNVIEVLSNIKSLILKLESTEKILNDDWCKIDIMSNNLYLDINLLISKSYKDYRYIFINLTIAYKQMICLLQTINKNLIRIVDIFRLYMQLLFLLSPASKLYDVKNLCDKSFNIIFLKIKCKIKWSYILLSYINKNIIINWSNYIIAVYNATVVQDLIQDFINMKNNNNNCVINIDLYINGLTIILDSLLNDVEDKLLIVTNHVKMNTFVSIMQNTLELILLSNNFNSRLNKSFI